MLDAERKPVKILLVEDNPGDLGLMEEAFAQSDVRVHLTSAQDGEVAMEILLQQGRYADAPLPDLILLDLNLPKKDGREVLAEIKAHESLRRIPVVVLTSSAAESDILAAYDLNANCYITKPMRLQELLDVVKYIEVFWLTIVKLPPSPLNAGRG